MQFQRNKLGFNEFSYNNKENSNSKSGEMAYMEPLGNQILSPSPISLGNERSIDSVDKKIKNNKQVPSRLSKQSPTIIQSVKNDLKNKIDIFYECSSLNELNLNNFNTNNVTDMSVMIDGCSSLKELNPNNFNTNNVTDMRSMFSGCSIELIMKIKARYKNINEEAFEIF